MPSAKPRQAAKAAGAKATKAAGASGGGLLRPNQNAIVYGGGGGIGGGIARALAREGARVFLAGRTLKSLEAVAEQIRAAGGTADVAEVDATDEHGVDAFVDSVAGKGGSVDISINVISYGDMPGRPLATLAPGDLTGPVSTAVLSNFLTARAATRHMGQQGSGVIITVSNGAAAAAAPGMGATSITAGAIETLTRSLACEVGPMGVRVLGLRIAAVPETWPMFTAADFAPVLDRIEAGEMGAGGPAGGGPAGGGPMGGGDTGGGPMGPPGGMDAIIEQLARTTMLHRLSTLAEVSDVAVFLASHHAGAMTGTITNVTCGMVPD
jgi:NAD(P)-dependent dehydrogenase (short-subunit alcohol dehydrogenase family)